MTTGPTPNCLPLSVCSAHWRASQGGWSEQAAEAHRPKVGVYCALSGRIGQRELNSCFDPPLIAKNSILTLSVMPKEALHNSSRNRVVRFGMGCKAVFAANIENICKKTNAADRPRPSYHEPRGVMQSFPNSQGLL